MKALKRIILSTMCLCSVVFTMNAQKSWPFSEFVDGSDAQNITINAGEYSLRDWHPIMIGNSIYSSFYGKSNVVLNSGAKLNYEGEEFQINPNTVFKVGSQFNSVYYFDIPVGNQSVKPRGGWVHYFEPSLGDTIMKYTGGVGLNSDWGLHLCTGSIQFGYFRGEGEKHALRIYDEVNYVDPADKYHSLTFAKVDQEHASAPMVYDFARIFPNGDVGIGMYPVYRLDVNKNMLANGYLKSSDKRLKSDIKTISNSVSIINQLLPKAYLKKTTNNREFGFIAQDIEKILPELVYKGKGKDDMYSVDYQGVLPVIVEAFKELQSNIDDNQNDLDEIENQLNN